MSKCTLGVLHIKAELEEDCESVAKMDKRVECRDGKVTLLKKVPRMGAFNRIVKKK